MVGWSGNHVLKLAGRLLGRIARDRSGNTLALVAASIAPLLALIGGGIDMGRSYLSESRLQQACDAGVLAARKKLGASVVLNGAVPNDVAVIGNRFFNLNFRNGAYGTEARTFAMTLNPDYSVSGVATVNVPTSIMRIFGFEQVAVKVDCAAQLNFANTDIMMVLDTTGSMNETNPGDTEPKISILRDVVKQFHAQVDGSKAPGTRIRFGFVPYATNVNVGRLLKSDWLVDSWTYNGRVADDTGTTVTGPVFDTSYTLISGTMTANPVFAAEACPADTLSSTQVSYWKDPDGTENWEYLVDGNTYSCSYLDGNRRKIASTTYNNYRYIYSYEDNGNQDIPVYTWRYRPVEIDVISLKGADGNDPPNLASISVPMGGAPNAPSGIDAFFRGCIEERETYEISDYNNVDLSRALDLDLDTVPTAGDARTQWRPALGEISYVRSIDWGGSGTFTPGQVTYDYDYLVAGAAGLSACPTEARKLAAMDSAEVASYVDSLVPSGSTYHDIGMIWGGRLLSAGGLFAAENADLPGNPTSRNLIFLTDGQTAPLDLSYGAYGVEPLDRRRWNQGSALTLTDVIEKRFTVACNEVKKRNITVWVIACGTSINPMLSQCAGPGHAFQADDATMLGETFNTIAKTISDLRVTS